MSSVQQNIARQVNKQENTVHTQEKKKKIPEEVQTLDLLDEDLKSGILNIKT